MKVKTDYVPEGIDYLTAGKVYDAIESGFQELYYIVDDDGDEISIYIECSSHIGGQPWQVVEE